jgi:DNA-binding CsgD family transcriptional regulator
MSRRPSFASLKTTRERNAYERAMQVHTALSKEEFRSLRRGELARMFGTTPGTVEKYLGSAVRRTGNGRWEPAAHDTLVKFMTVLTEDGPLENVPIRGDRNRSIVAGHEAAVRRFAETGDPRYLRALDRVTVTDANGREHRLVTDERALRRMIRRGDTQGVQPY